MGLWKIMIGLPKSDYKILERYNTILFGTDVNVNFD